MYPIFLISIIYFKKKTSLNTFFIILFIFIYFFSIYLSGERTAFFNFIILNFFLFIILYEKKYTKYLLLFLLILPIIFTYVVKNSNNPILARYLSIKEIFNNKTPTIFSETHENHYKSAFKIYKSYPLFGSGLKTFRYVCKKPEHNPMGCATHPHNIFMLFLSELGFIGIIFYLIVFFYFGARLVKLFIARFNNNNFRNNNPILTIIIVSMFMSFWPFSPSGNYFNNWMSVLNFLPMGFLIYYDKKINL